MKNLVLYLASALTSTMLLVCFAFGIIEPINSLIATFVFVVIGLGYVPFFGTIFLDFKNSKI